MPCFRKYSGEPQATHGKVHSSRTKWPGKPEISPEPMAKSMPLTAMFRKSLVNSISMGERVHQFGRAPDSARETDPDDSQ